MAGPEQKPERTPQGDPLDWTDAELDELLEPTETRQKAIADFWRQAAPKEMANLLDAETEEAAMSKLSKEERDKLKESDFGDPEGRRYPIVDASDVSDAASLIGKAGSQEEKEKIKKRIIAIAKRKGFPIPDSWKEDADMSRDPIFEFTLDEANFADEGDSIIRDVPLLWRADKYPDKKYEMTAADNKKAVAAFNKPVEIGLQHTSTVLDGKLGQFIQLEAKTPDFAELKGKVKIPKWLDAILEPGKRALSATWDRATKTLKAAHLVLTPRVTGAAIEAAFAAHGDETDDDDEDEKSKSATGHGQKILQHLHDVSATHGAHCSGEAKMSIEDHVVIINAHRVAEGRPDLIDGATGYAQFMMAEEHQALQKVHDAVTEAGGQCGVGMLKDVQTLKHYVDTNPMSQTLASHGKTPPPESEEVKKLRAEFEAERALRQKESAEREAAFAAEQKKRIHTEAAAFADELKRKGHIFPAQQKAVAGRYEREALQDAQQGGEVEFSVMVPSADAKSFTEEAKKGSRIDALKAEYCVKVNPLMQEGQEVKFGAVLENKTAAFGEEKPMSAEEEEKMLNMTPQGREILAKRKSGQGAPKTATEKFRETCGVK